MDAIIGRYKAHMEESGLVLTHPTGLCFDFTIEEALDLLDFIKVYQRALVTKERDTNPELERVIIDEDPG
jgi:hypothetical protein